MGGSKTVFSGPYLGEQKAQDLTYQEGVVDGHNRQLRCLPLSPFSLPTQGIDIPHGLTITTPIKMDWSIFQMNVER